MTRLIANPLFLFLAVWTGATSLYLTGVYTGTFPAPEPRTLPLVLLSVATFSLGYLTWTLLQGLRPGAGVPLLPTQPLTRERIARVLRLCLLMGVIALLLVLYRIALIASRYNTSILDLLTQPEMLRLRLVLFIGRDVYQTSHMVILISLTSGLFSIGFVLLGVFLYVGTTAAKYFYLGAFLALSLAIGLLNLSRYEVTVNILYLILAYCLTYAADRHRRLWRILPDLLLPLAAVLGLYIAIDVLLRKGLTYGRTGQVQGFLFSLYWYAASPLAAFNDWLSTFRGGYDLGQNTFFPLFKWFYRLHLVAEPDVSVYGEIIRIPYAANVYTYLRNFYEDFGILGVALGPYLLGWLTAAVRPRAGRCFHYLNLYVVLLVFILLSFYNYFLFSNQIYLQILFGFLFFRYELTSGHERIPCEQAADESAVLYSR